MYKGKAVPQHATKAYGIVEDIACLTFFNLSTR